MTDSQSRVGRRTVGVTWLRIVPRTTHGILFDSPDSSHAPRAPSRPIACRQPSFADAPVSADTMNERVKMPYIAPMPRGDYIMITCTTDTTTWIALALPQHAPTGTSGENQCSSPRTWCMFEPSDEPTTRGSPLMEPLLNLISYFSSINGGFPFCIQQTRSRDGLVNTAEWRHSGPAGTSDGVAAGLSAAVECGELPHAYTIKSIAVCRR